MGRKEILKELEEIIYEAMGRCSARNYRNSPDNFVNVHKLRQGYYNSLASLINSYARLSKDVEINELEEELEELKKELLNNE